MADFGFAAGGAKGYLTGLYLLGSPSGLREVCFMAKEEDYKVRLDVFEGPLDLLLYLIRQEEVDIYDIPIGRIADQYQAYIQDMKNLNLDVAGEFLVMAATLMMIKSRMLLPAEDRAVEEEEEADPRWDLVRQLVEYKKFKDAAFYLDALQGEREDVFVRDDKEAALGKEPDLALREVGLYDLIKAFSEAVRRVKPEERWEIFPERFSVPEKVEVLRDRLKKKDRFSLTQMFADMHSRQEVACTFLALLELIRLRVARAVQEGTYGEILVAPGDGDADAPLEDAEALEEAAELIYSTEGLPEDARRKVERRERWEKAKRAQEELALAAGEAVAEHTQEESGDAASLEGDAFADEDEDEDEWDEDDEEEWDEEDDDDDDEEEE